MPELPEVETQARGLQAIIGYKFQELKSNTPKEFTPSFPKFRRQILGAQIRKIWRRAKFLIFDLDQQQKIIIHFRMTGHFLYSQNAIPREKAIRHFFYLQAPPSQKNFPIKVLQFADIRKFATFKLVSNPDFPPPEIQKLGPEPLAQNFTWRVFQKLFAQQKGKLKQVLLQQTFLAGIGNIYADEICFSSGVRPEREISTLQATEQQKIFQEIKKQLQKGVKNCGTTVGEFVDIWGKHGHNQNSLQVYKRYGQPCLACKCILQKTKVSQRTTTFCWHCQK